MSNDLLDLLLVRSFNLNGLIEDYRNFFLALLPSVFLIAVLVEFFDRMDTFNLVRRAFISILILCSVTLFYEKAIYASIEAANTKLSEQKQSSLLLMSFLDADSEIYKMSNKSTNESDSIITKMGNFIKTHLFTNFINDGFTTVVYFLTQLSLILIKLVYSMVYYLGYGLIGIPCLIFLFPSMGNVLRGSVLSFIWCLIIPHILVFIISMIGSEIEKGYISGTVIGGSVSGTALLFLMTIFIAFSPLIAMMIVNGSGIAQAGGIIASIGANHIMSLPKTSLNQSASYLSGDRLGPKMNLAKNTIKGMTKLPSSTANAYKRIKSNSNTNLGMNTQLDSKMENFSVPSSSRSNNQAMSKNSQSVSLRNHQNSKLNQPGKKAFNQKDIRNEHSRKTTKKAHEYRGGHNKDKNANHHKR